MSHARKSVADSEIQKYEEYVRSLRGDDTDGEGLELDLDASADGGGESIYAE